MGYGDSLTELWSRDLHLRGHTWITRQQDSVLVVAERHTRLVRLDPRSGEVLWDVRVDDVWGTLALDGDLVVYGSGSGRVRALRLLDGETVSEHHVGRFGGFVSVRDGVVVSGGWRGYRDVDGRTLDGHLIWAADRPDLRGEQVRPLMTPDGLYGSRRGSHAVSLLDPRTGDVTQRWELPEPIATTFDESTPFVPVDDGRMLVRCGHRTVVSCSPAGVVEVVWQHDTDLADTPPAVLHGALWAVDLQGARVIDLERSQVVGAWRSPHRLVRAVATPSGVVAADESGVVAHLGLTGEPRSRTIVPRPVADLSSAASDVVHVLAKGRLVALGTPPGLDEGGTQQR